MKTIELRESPYIQLAQKFLTSSIVEKVYRMEGDQDTSTQLSMHKSAQGHTLEKSWRIEG